MDSFEWNKVAGAVLGSALLLMVIGEIGGILVHPTAPESSVLNIDVSSLEGGEQKGEKAPEETVPFATLLAKASVEAGERQAKKCMSCHNFEEGAGAKVGPDLWNVIGRDKASVEGFSYSSALQELGGKWTYEDLSHFIANPREYAPGTKMTFAGLKKADDRADLIAWLRTRHDEPLPPLPEPPQAAEPAGGTAPAEKGQAAPTEGEQANPGVDQPTAPGGANQPQQ